MRFIQAGVMLLGAIGYAVLLAWFYSISQWAVDGEHGLEELFIPAGGGPVEGLYDPVLQVSIPVLIAWNAALLIVTVLVLVDSVKKVRAGNTEQLTQGALLVKLAAIPFFVINFVPLALFGLTETVLIAFGGAIGLVGVAVAVVLTYLAMLSTSIYGWASVRRLHRDKRINRAQAAIYSILLCLFVLDIVGGILLFAETRRARRASAVPVALN